MKVSVFGLGYVGCVTGACLAKHGHDVIGVDVNPVKVKLINDGDCPIVEPGLAELIADVTNPQRSEAGGFRATDDGAQAIANSDVTMICVGTPSDQSGNVNLDGVGRCVASIADSLAAKDAYHVVVVRSTVPPGTTAGLIASQAVISQAVAAGRLGFSMNPEFLREGSSIEDFENPPVTIIGESDPRAGEVVESLYGFIDAAVVHLDLRAAEMIKYVNNAFHALKVTFANEIGSLCKSLAIDSHDVMNVVCMDDKLNISRKYLTPGFAFGGSCLPKDLRALNYIARHEDIQLPLLDSMLPSNRLLVERTAQRVRDLGKRRVSMLGLSFKKDTDDLRESPFVTLAEELIGKGFELKVFDTNVSVSRLIGANAAYIKEHLPHIDNVISDDLEAVMAFGDVIVVCNYEDAYGPHFSKLGSNKTVVDLARIADDLRGSYAYEGLAW
jgi:GDP-mannose 6-dehydrogenase